METTENGELLGVLDEAFSQLERLGDARRSAVAPRAFGRVVAVFPGVARVRGLRHAKSEELVWFRGDRYGMIFDAGVDECGVALFDPSEEIEVGSEARRTGRVLDVPVGDGVIGRVIDALGRPLDHAGAVAAEERRPVERAAPGVLDRAPVSIPMQTGIKTVDALVPIGRGQRELIVGDRQTGKTAIALDAIANQNGADVTCIYCAVGQRGTAVAKAIDALRRRGALDYTVVVVASGDDPAGLQFVCPFAAMTLAEAFMEQGRDVLVVFDDLTRHAQAYRELSLLLRRPPGREAYPGDVFFLHSRLLERATHLDSGLGGGSITALPIVETEAQNIAAYIPTNLISITDGQIYLSPTLFQKGHLPAIDVGKSVSRVGGKAQLPAYAAFAGNLRLSYSQFEELEMFSRFGTRLDEDTLRTLEHGRRVREMLKQTEFSPLSPEEQIVVLFSTSEGVLDEIPLDRMKEAEQALRHAAGDGLEQVCRKIRSAEPLSRDDRETIVRVAREATATLARDAPAPETEASRPGHSSHGDD